jgi:UPF0176 protein
MTYSVAALYQFFAFPDYKEKRETVRAFCNERNIRGTLLLASEGINGTLAGSREALNELVFSLENGTLLGQSLNNLELKWSSAQEMPFKRLKIRLKKEIVTLGRPEADPLKQVGTYVSPQDWNALIKDPDTVVIDTRNDFEVALGTFENAKDPKTKSFGEFPDYVERNLKDVKTKKIAMFCTGGIRCEKATAYMLEQGFEHVYHLKGGILHYLETIDESQSLWQGECFVFDERVALGHGLTEAKNTNKQDKFDRL